MFLGVVTNQEIMDVLQTLNNKSIWEAALSTLTPVAASVITLLLSNKHSEKQLKIQLQNERKNEQVKAVLDAYKELKALESWGCEPPSRNNLEKMDDEFPEVREILALNEFYIPNEIYTEMYNIRNEWSDMSDKYNEYLKGNKAISNKYIKDNVLRLIQKRHDLRDMIKKEFGYS